MLDIWLDYKLMADLVARQRANVPGGQLPLPDMSLLSLGQPVTAPPSTPSSAAAMPPANGQRASGPLAPSAAAAVPAEPLTAADAADLHRRADTLFHSKQFKAAQPMFRRLHVHAPRDWIAWMKLGACLTFSGDPAELADGELELRRLSELLPGSPRVYMLLGQNLSRQQRWADCVEAVQRGLQCHPQDDSPDYVIDGLKCARESLDKLGRRDEFESLGGQARAMYPHLAPRLAELTCGLDVEQLKAEGGALMQQKNFAAAVPLFDKVVAARPNDYWMTYNLAVCLTWSARAAEAEPWIAKAIALEPRLPNAHTLLVRNYAVQRKLDSVLDAAQRMMSQPLLDRDYTDKFVEVLTCVKNTHGNGPKLQDLIAKAKARYPASAAQFDAVRK
eukprot:TRINITY_DN3151_c0_g1_i3.p2 TRINITY_DN3151_c0_g1~~TRINITY_DN3151_c0_g1_i3.p2  ORF type:complete len:390 (+),score=141.20 TRINITY_DN3151_c0_g1_i3:751-1920(+)